MEPLLEELLRVPGIPGYEDRVRALVRKRLPKGVAVTEDTMGNLVASLGEAPRVMFVAHMDEIGFVVSEIREDGFLKLKPLGGIDPRTVFGQLLRVITSDGEVSGAITVKPPHLMKERATETKEVPPVTEFFIDIGAASRDEAKEMGVDLLDFAVLDKHVATLNGKFACARALDDRVGCYVQLKALERLAGDDPPAAYFAFSVQEEIGLRGASRLARHHELDFAFAIDSTSTADFPGVSADLSPGRLGEGPCLRVLDNATVIPPAFRKELAALAAEAGIPLQIVFSGGGTDARPFQPEGPQVMSIGIPLRYTHSAVEMAHLDDIEKTIDFVCAVANRYGRDG